MKLLLKLVILQLVVSIGVAVHAQESLIPPKIRADVRERVEGGKFAGIVIGVFDLNEVEYFSYGKTELDGGSDVNEHSVFEIGSVSKVFTSLLLANRVVLGEMRLSDPIGQHLPKGVKTPSRNNKEITLESLVTHSSGLPRLPNNMVVTNLNQPYVNYSRKDMIDFLSSYELTRDIGEHWEYSSYAFGLLGYIMELNAQMDYEELMTKEIAKPLHMESTGVDLSPSMKERLAYGHRKGKKLLVGHDMSSMIGGAGIRSSAEDLVKFLQANVLGTHPSMAEAMLLSHKVAFKDEKNRKKVGLGWFRTGEVVWHGGNTPGYAAFIGFNKKTKKGAVILINSAGIITQLGMQLLVNGISSK